MDVLQEHRKRVTTLRDGLSRLLDLHRKVHDLHSESMAIAKARQPESEEKIRALREQARDLHQEIEMVREQLDDMAAER